MIGVNVHSARTRKVFMNQSTKRDEIIKAALELIAEHGFHGAPMSMISEKASVGAGTIYRYFENKDELIAKLFEDLSERLVSALRQNYSPAAGSKERFLHLCRSLMEYFISHPVDFRFLEQYFNSPYGVSMRREKIRGKAEEGDLFREFFETGIERKVLKDFPLHIHFGMTIGPMIFLARDHILGLIDLSEGEIQKAAEACWDAIKR